MNPAPCRPRAARFRAIACLAAVGAAALFQGSALAQAGASACGPVALLGGYGPYDYRTDRDKLGIVERPHFPPLVEALIKSTRSTIGGDISYTLIAFPNHHRALVAVMRYGEKVKSPHPRDLRFSVECYFDRALRFRPDDNMARMIYAQFLTRNNRPADALAQLSVTESKAGDNGFTHYNLGMLYADLKQYDKALASAHEAHRLGFIQPALRERLAAAGKWTEPEAARPAAAASAAEGSAATAPGAAEPGSTAATR